MSQDATATYVDDFESESTEPVEAVVAAAVPGEAPAGDVVVDDIESADAGGRTRDASGRLTGTGEPVDESDLDAEPAAAEEVAAVPVEEEPVVDPDIDVATGLKKSARPYKLVQQYEQAAKTAQREAAELRAQVEALKRQPEPAKTEPASVDGLPRPLLNDFESWDDWSKADDAWIRGEIKRESARVAAETQKASEAQFVQRQIAAKLDQVTTECAKKYPDFDAVVTAAMEAGAIWSPLMTNVVLSSPRPEDLAYALAKDPGTARRLAAIADPFQAGVEMGQFIARVTAASTTGPAATQRTTAAHAPIKPVGSSVIAAEQSPDDLDFGPEYVRRMNAKDREVARRR
jgi:hypothetical protein